MKVSIICPTNRPYNIPRVTEMYHRQNYMDIELIVVQDGNTIGEKRNIACSEAKGDIIVHFDDDDFYSGDYVSKCVEVIKSGADVTGLNKAYFVSLGQHRAWVYDSGSDMYVIGSGMAYKRSIWANNRFAETSQGEDRLFLRSCGVIKPHGYMGGFAATIHSRNTCSHLTVPYMTEVGIEYVKKNINFELY